jgi:glycosyltransferase involved in cell wall biosynthesis
VVAAGPFHPATYLAPVRDAPVGRDLLPPVDTSRLEVVPTAAFNGAAGYLVRYPVMVARNAGLLARAISAADLLWIKAPASNAPLAAIAARRAGTPRFTYVAGSAAGVVAARRRRGLGDLRGVPARVAAWAYDGVTTLLSRTGPAIRLDAEIFTSDITTDDVSQTRLRRNGADLPRANDAAPIRLSWAGRLAPEKGLDDLLDVVASSRAGGRDVRLRVIGDGREREALERQATGLGLGDAVEWTGFVGDHDRYLGLLRDTDIFVLPSRSEGVPKAALDAMAAGLPIIATNVGNVPAVVVDGERGLLIPAGNRIALAGAIEQLSTDPDQRRRLAEAGLAWAEGHTRERQAERLVAWMRDAFPELPWPETTGT